MRLPESVDVSQGSQTPILTVLNGWKSFGHVTALRDVNLQVYPGEVLALLGDNGAGKSTLVKVLGGVHTLDQGAFSINGARVDRADPKVALSGGISAVFQDLAVVETLDVAANVFLGRPLTRFRFFVAKRRMVDESARILRELRIRVPSVRVPVGELSGGQRQGVAIARAVRQDTPIILMDEPTAALGVRETAQVRNTITELQSQGKAVVLVSHDLEFVFSVADRVQVMRLGAVQGVRRVSESSRDEVVGLITGAIPPDGQGGAN